MVSYLLPYLVLKSSNKDFWTVASEEYTAAEAAAAKLRRTPSVELKTSSGGDCHYTVGVDVGAFGRPAATGTVSLEFKHVADAAFVQKCSTEAPLVFFSLDLRMIRGRATAEEHQKFWERMLQPALDLLRSTEREFSGLQLNVSSVMDVVRITVMMPHPPTHRLIAERRDKIAEYERKLAHARKHAPDSASSIEKPDLEDEAEYKQKVKESDPVDALFTYLGAADLHKFVKKAQLRVETGVSWDLLDELINGHPSPERAAMGLLDFYKFRVRLEAIYDPAIMNAIEQAFLAVSESMPMARISDRDKRKLKHLLWGTLLKHGSFVASFGDVKSLMKAGESMDRAGRGRRRRRGGGDEEDEEEGKEYTHEKFLKDLENPRQTPALINHLVTMPLKESVRHWGRMMVKSMPSYKRREAQAILTACKVITTIVAKDVDEIGAFHVRHKSGLGVSVSLDRYTPLPALANLFAAAKWPQFDDDD